MIPKFEVDLDWSYNGDVDVFFLETLPLQAEQYIYNTIQNKLDDWNVESRTTYHLEQCVTEIFEHMINDRLLYKHSDQWAWNNND